MASSNVQAEQAIAEVYARALFELALEQGALAQVADELHSLRDLLSAEKDLAAFFAHRTIAAERRATSLRNIFEGRVSDLTLRFMLVLNRNGRMAVLAHVADAFDKLVKEHRGEIDVEVHTARPLDAGQLDRVRDKVSAALGKTAVLHARIDENLIGGLKLRVGDKLIDASVRNQLQRIKQQLAQRGRELIRSNAASLLQEG
jgi:F-type H+-transporting ATPase subunit delta